MNWLNVVTVVAHVLFAVSIIALVLLQRGKGAEAGAGFGAGASGTVFGARGSASFMSRTTAVLAGLFFVTSITLAYFSGQVKPPSSVMDKAVVEQPAESVPREAGPTTAPVPAATTQPEVQAPMPAPAPAEPATK
jgi:preprotein translocase subunit SecG